MALRTLLLIFWTTICAGQTPGPICMPPLKPDPHPESFIIMKDAQTFKIWFTKDEQTGKLIRGKPQLEREPRSLPPDPNDEMVVEYECDGPTRIKAIRYRLMKDPSFKKTVYEYNINGLKTERSDYFADGTLDRLEKYGYDENGNVSEEISKQHVHPVHFNPKRYDVYVTTRRTFGYDNKRNKTSELHYRPDGSFYAKWVFEYDSRNNLIKDTRIDNLGRLEHQ